MNTEFFKEMTRIKRENSWSRREMSKHCGLCYGTLIEFFNIDKPFRPLRDKTMAQINHAFGISFEIMEDYNKYVKENKGE